MIVFSNASGNVIYTSPEAVYQGSSLSGTVYFLAPLGQQCSVTVSFELPDGSIIGPYAMTPSASITGVQDSGGDTYNSWIWSVSDNAVTSIAGTVVAQFTVYLPNGTGQNLKTLTTATTQFIVEQGVIPAMPSVPDTDTWETVLQTYNALAERVLRLENEVTNKVLVDFTVNSVTGEGVKYYSDGTTANVQFPTGGGSATIISDYLKELTFTESSFVENEGVYELAFGSQQTGYSNSQFIVLLFSSGSETYEAGTETTPSERTGYYTQSDTVLVGSDGSIYLAENQAFNGRLLLLGGSVYSGKVITTASYSTETHILTLNYVNGDTDKLQYETNLSQFKNDLEYVASAVYNSKIYQLTITYRDGTEQVYQLPVPGAAQRYTANFLTTDWQGDEAPYSISISATTHNKGVNPTIYTYDSSGNIIYLGVNKDTSGNLTLYSNVKIDFEIIVI